MPLRKKKISELPLADSLKGLYTIGYKIIDGIKTSVKVSLEDIQTAYQDVVNAIKKSEEAAKNANNAAVTANEKASLANTAAANANDTAEHPTYIGTDHYVYKWNKTAQAYDKTDIYCKGDAFSIKKVYASVANMEADKSNPDIAEGDFVLVNTGDVEDPDNAKLYVKADGDFEFLVDMSGAIGFTGKTPQFSMGTATTLEAGASAIVTVSDDGTDSDGNPMYKINFAIPRGNPGAPFRVSGEYATLEALKSAVPDGSAVDGFMAVGTETPYDYYAWVNGDWVNQGKIAGGGSGNVVIVPIWGLTTQSTSDEIFNAFGGKQNLIDIIKKVKDEDCVVIAKTDDDPNAVLQQTFSVVNATYVNDNTLILGLISWSVNVTSQMIIQVIDGVASYNEISTPLMTEAPSDGNAYGRKNKGWAEVPEKPDVLTKDNETEYTPTEPYNPATKKYDTISGKVKRLNLDILSPLVSNISITETGSHTQVDEKLNQLFGSVSDYRDVVTRLSKGELSGIEVYNTNNLATNLDTKRIIFSNICAVANDEDDDFRDLYATYSYLEYTKRIIITYRLSTNEYSYKINDLVSSNNITNITQMTSSQYEQLSLKSSHTMYAITD